MQLGWIDFSRTERDKVLSVLDLLVEKGTVDEIGIAPVRDGFSNLFFPGTSVNQSRAKYFLVVPYVFKELERGRDNNFSSVMKSLERLEKQCAQNLYASDPSEKGIIGADSIKRGAWVKNTPSSIYWAGLRKYGIFTGGAMSMAEYISAACSQKNTKTNLKNLGNRKDNAEEHECDDDDAGNLYSMQFWKLPEYDCENWMETLSVKLTENEGVFLKEQIISAGKGSMLAYILENNITEFLECDSFQDMGRIIDIFPNEIQENFRLAFQFSDFVYVLRTLFNIIVSDGKDEFANEELRWLEPQLSIIAETDLSEIFNRIDVSKNPMLRRFLTECQEYMASGKIDEMKASIVSREVYLKGVNRAKTKHIGEIDSKDWPNLESLHYRFYKAQTIVADIMESEGLINA